MVSRPLPVCIADVVAHVSGRNRERMKSPHTSLEWNVQKGSTTWIGSSCDSILHLEILWDEKICRDKRMDYFHPTRYIRDDWNSIIIFIQSTDRKKKFKTRKDSFCTFWEISIHFLGKFGNRIFRKLEWLKDIHQRIKKNHTWWKGN